MQGVKVKVNETHIKYCNSRNPGSIVSQEVG